MGPPPSTPKFGGGMQSMRPPPVDVAHVHPDGQSFAALQPSVQKLPAPVGKHNPDPQSEFLVHEPPTDNPELGQPPRITANSANSIRFISIPPSPPAPARALLN
jgi:hypothetical protein